MERFYRLLLHLYPRDLRRRFAGDMRRTFRDLLARERAGGSAAVLRLCLREAAEIASDALGERLRRASFGPVGAFLPSLFQDLGLAARGLRSKPGLTAVVVLTLALAVGANASVFSIVQATLLRPLPFPDSQQLVMLWEDRSARDGSEKEWVEWPLIQELKRRTQVFSAAGVFQLESGALAHSLQEKAAAAGEQGDSARADSLTVLQTASDSGVQDAERRDSGPMDAQDPRPVTVVEASAGFLEALQLSPLLGRRFHPGQEDAPQAPRLVLLSEELWKSAFASDESVVGSKIILDEEEATVIGVMPDLHVPELGEADIWLNLRADEHSYPMGHFTLRALGRLKPGTSLRAAERRLNQALQQAARSDRRFGGIGVRLSPLAQEVQPAALRQGLMLMMAATVCLLLAGCANIAGLLLGRVLNRRPEMALRSALGGGRPRLLRLVLTENLLLALLGGAAGWTVAWLSGSLLAELAPAGLLPAQAWPQAASGWLGRHASTVLFTLAVSVLGGLLFGLLPALHLARWPASALTSSRPPLAHPGHPRLRTLLVAGQVSLALLLLVASGLLLRSFDRLMQVELGFDPQDRFAFHLETPDAQQAKRLIRQLPDLLRSDPEIEQAALISPLPLSGADTDIDLTARPAPQEQRLLSAPRSRPVWYRRIDAGYLEAMGIPVLAGRGLTQDDLRLKRRVAVVSQAAADFFWPGQSPLGRHLGAGDWKVQVVGVMAGVRHNGLRQSPLPEIYLPASMIPHPAVDLVVGSSAPLSRLSEKVRRQVLEVAPASAVSPPVSLHALAQDALVLPRFLTVLTSVFALLALLCALLGIASSLTSYVQGRRGELGLRLALGARRRHLFTGVLARGMTLAGAGLAMGWILSLAAAMGLSEGLGQVLFRTTPSDGATYLLVSILLVSFSLAASLIPAWQASRTDPLRTLRE